MPADKVIEARHQTQQKLELMEREWGAWCSILAQTVGKYAFCPSHLWLIDTHAGSGRHLSASDPDGEIPGTPMLGALAARGGPAEGAGRDVPRPGNGRQHEDRGRAAPSSWQGPGHAT